MPCGSCKLVVLPPTEGAAAAGSLGAGAHRFPQLPSFPARQAETHQGQKLELVSPRGG